MKTTTPIAPADRPGRNGLHAYVSDDCYAEWQDAADEHGVTMTALIEALGPRLAKVLAADPGIVADSRRVFSVRRKRNGR